MPPLLVLPPSASSATALALPRLSRASPSAPHEPIGQDGRLSADGKPCRPQKIHHPSTHPNPTIPPINKATYHPGQAQT